MRSPHTCARGQGHAHNSKRALARSCRAGCGTAPLAQNCTGAVRLVGGSQQAQLSPRAVPQTRRRAGPEKSHPGSGGLDPWLQPTMCCAIRGRSATWDRSISPASTRSEPLNAWHAASKSSVMKSRFEKPLNQNVVLGRSVGCWTGVSEGAPRRPYGRWHYCSRGRGAGIGEAMTVMEMVPDAPICPM